MAPHSRVFLTRHAEAEHNVDLDYSIPDAPLTALGKKQAAALALKIPELQEQVELVVTSPLKRTLETTLRSWGPAIKRLGIENVICLPEAQECNDFPCDTGSSRAILENIKQFQGLNFASLTPDWNSKTGIWAPDAPTIANRAKRVRHFLRDRPERDIVLVAHGDILRRITCDATGPSTYMWRNAEVRCFVFDPATVEQDECYLVLDHIIEAAGGYGPTSTDLDLDLDQESNGKL